MKVRTAVEPVLLLISISLNALPVLIQSFYIHSACRLILSKEEPSGASRVCNDLSSYPDMERRAQAYTLNYATVRIFLETGPPILFGFFWGSLNDRLGSKVPLIIPVLGFALSSLIYTVCAWVDLNGLGYLVLGSVPMGLFGGGVAASVSLNKYIISVTTPEERTFRLSLIHGVTSVSGPIGTVLGAQLYHHKGFSGVFLGSLGLQLLGLAYLVLVLQNNRPVKPSPTELSVQSAPIRDTLGVFFRSRDSRSRLLSLVGVYWLYLVITNAKSSLSYLYARTLFGWDQEAFSYYSVTDGLISSLGVPLSTLIGLKVLKLSNYTLGVVGALGSLLSSLLWLVATEGWVLYVVSLFKLVETVIPVVTKASISLLLLDTETGKALSCLSILESLTPLLIIPLYNSLYSASLDSHLRVPLFLTHSLSWTLFGLSCFLLFGGVGKKLGRKED